jgi:glutathione peroxidase-family protein
MSDFYGLTMDDIHGNPTPMSTFTDTACLLVNVASR